MLCQLQAKCDSLTILKSLKKKNKNGQRSQPSTKQKCFYELKRIHICDFLLGLLPQTSPGGFRLLSSISISTYLRLLPQGDLGLYPYLYLFLVISTYEGVFDGVQSIGENITRWGVLVVILTYEEIFYVV